MTRTSRIATALLALTLLPAALAHAEWVHVVDSFFVAAKPNQPHPKSLTRTLAVEGGFESNRNKLCAVYVSNHPKENQGGIKT